MSAPSGRPLPRRGAPGLRLLADLFRPGATSLGAVVPLVLVLTALALVVALVGEALVPWVIYPAL